MKDKKKLIILIIVAVVAVIGIIVGILFATGTIGGEPEEETTTTTAINPVIDEMQSVDAATDGKYMSGEEMPNPSFKFDQSTIDCTVGINTTMPLDYQAPKDVVNPKDGLEFSSASVDDTSKKIFLNYESDSYFISYELFYTSLNFIEENYVGCVVVEGEIDSDEFIQSIYNANHKMVVTSTNKEDSDKITYTVTTVTDLEVKGTEDLNSGEIKERYYNDGKEVDQDEFYKLYQEVDPAVKFIFNS